MIPSKKFTLSLRDWAQGFITAFLSATLTGLTQSIVLFIDKGQMITLEDVKGHIAIGISAGGAHLIRKYLSNSEGKILKKEPKKPVQ